MRLLLLFLLLSCKRERIEPTRDDARAVPRVESLEGVWRADVSHRRLEAKRRGDHIDFVVLDPAEWHHAFEKGEVRFTLEQNSDGTFRVTDRYRPFLDGPYAGFTYTDAGREACLTVRTEHIGKPLVATLGKDGGLTVEFVEISRGLYSAAGAAKSVTGCHDVVTVRGPITRVLHRLR